MKGHPLHGVNPLVDKIGKKCDWGDGSKHVYLFKLERPAKNRYLCREVHPTARFIGHAVKDDKNHLQPGTDAKAWARNYPGWTVVFA